MERNHILGMVCGYYLSRFDRVAYSNLGFETQQATHEALGTSLGVPPESIKNWRDEFDPVHDNPRRGWHRREMYPSRRRTIEALGHLTEPELQVLVRAIADSPRGGPADEIVQSIDDGVGEQDRPDVFGLRGPTGVKAEEAFERFHAEHAEPMLGRLIDRRHDQCGYDYEIKTHTESVFIEVKGLAGVSGGITFTDKEWRTAREAGNSYVLALVRNVASEPTVSLLRDPAGRLAAQMRTYTTVQTGWAVTQGELSAAQGGAIETGESML